MKIDLCNKNTGIYFLNIKTDETEKTYKIIKE
ncbi:MAG: T9SS type A sorting domain-containing protein [Bacteroidales bacterium]|nr:T9SS type A sorting domain-containing protein [Bacteroidales bacterium]